MSLTVPAGDIRPCFSVSIINDNIYKTNKQFHYSLGSHDPHHVTIQGSPLVGVVEIEDNDAKAVIVGFENENYYVVENGSVEACVWLTGARIGQSFSIRVFTAHTSKIPNGKLQDTFTLDRG